MRQRHGFILIAALWLIVALSAVGLDAALRSQASRTPAMNQLDLSRAREAALAGSAYAESRLTAALQEREAELRAQAEDEQRASGAAQPFGRQSARNRNRMSRMLAQSDPWRDPHELMASGRTFGDSEFTLDVHDTGVALNLNEATEDMLRNFLSQGLRIDYAAADRLTQAILDWRDQDDIPRINGGEAEQYVNGGAAVLPANGLFADPDELRHVMGMTPEIFDAMRPHVTVVGSGRINLNAAPEPVLLAVPTFTRPAVAELLRLRNAGQYPRDAGELRALLGRAYRPPGDDEQGDFTRSVAFSTHEVEVVSNGRVTGSMLDVQARTVISLSQGGAVVTWRRVD
jgi:type II secretory pathway component PulK